MFSRVRKLPNHVGKLSIRQVELSLLKPLAPLQYQSFGVCCIEKGQYVCSLSDATPNTHIFQSPSTGFKGIKKYTAAAEIAVSGKISRNIHRL